MSSRYGLSIRAADASDAVGLAGLLGAADIGVGLDRLAARLTASIAPPGVVLLAEEWGPPSGVIVSHWLATLTADLTVGVVSLLFVHPERRRNGVARRLVKAASQAARTAGCGELVLSFPSQAEDVRAFCLETGFTQAGETFTRSLRKRS